MSSEKPGIFSVPEIISTTASLIVVCRPCRRRETPLHQKLGRLHPSTCCESSSSLYLLRINLVDEVPTLHHASLLFAIHPPYVYLAYPERSNAAAPPPRKVAFNIHRNLTLIPPHRQREPLSQTPIISSSKEKLWMDTECCDCSVRVLLDEWLRQKKEDAVMQ